MYPFVETIALDNCRLINLDLHQERLNRTLSENGITSEIRLDEVIVPYIKNIQKESGGLYKCRVVYTTQVESIELTPYTSPVIRKVGIVNTNITYTYKSTDRSAFAGLHKMYPGFDDFLLIKNGELTDSTFCNIAVQCDGDWYTPVNPLLEGVQRAFLLADNKIKKRVIRIEYLSDYTQIAFFNALNLFGSHLLEINQLIDLRQIEPIL
ncbi:MAG: aminotransferase class IV [Bacteroidales bacterium]